MPLWLATEPLILASRSAARRAILSAAGIPAEVQPAEIDERKIEAETPGDAAAAARLLARRKAQAGAMKSPGRLVLGADQTLALGTRRFSKPEDKAAAAEQLRSLRGKTHALHSALALVRGSEILFEHDETARLTMRGFSEKFLAGYIEAAGDAVTESVGGYHLEGLGAQLFEHIEGDYFTVLGLPLFALLGFLRRAGYLAD